MTSSCVRITEHLLFIPIISHVIKRVNCSSACNEFLEIIHLNWLEVHLIRFQNIALAIMTQGYRQLIEIMFFITLLKQR